MTFNRAHSITPAALALAFACLTPAASQAKDGDDSSGNAIVVSAAACTEVASPARGTDPSTTTSRSLLGGAFTVTGGATATLVCPLAPGNLDSDDGDKTVSFQVDVWVEGSRQWCAVEDQLISPALFAAMREAGPLPVAVPATAEAYLAERRALLDQRLAEVAAKAAADRLKDVRIAGDAMRISPLRAATPEEAETLAKRLYATVPAVRITDLLVEVDRWTGFSAA